MTGSDANADNAANRPLIAAPRQPFPAIRLLYAAGFAVVAWFVFWIALLIAAVQFVLVAVTGQVNGELKAFSLSLNLYLRDLLAYVLFLTDTQPFPFSPFPRQA